MLNDTDKVPAGTILDFRCYTRGVPILLGEAAAKVVNANKGFIEGKVKAHYGHQVTVISALYMGYEDDPYLSIIARNDDDPTPLVLAAALGAVLALLVSLAVYKIVVNVVSPTGATGSYLGGIGIGFLIASGLGIYLLIRARG